MPMVAGVRLNSLAQAAAATLKLLRSAHRSRLPAKKTTTQTGQLIGRRGSHHPISRRHADVEKQHALPARPLARLRTRWLLQC